MGKIVKIIGALLLLVVLGAGALITFVEVQTRRSEREVASIIAQLPPGTPFSEVVQRLGQPRQSFTNSQEILSWTEAVGARVAPQLATNSTLYTFIHRGPPFRFILVYTDPEGRKVIHADWCHM